MKWRVAVNVYSQYVLWAVRHHPWDRVESDDIVVDANQTWRRLKL